MKRGSLRCELDSATPSGLQQAAIGGTGGERVRPAGSLRYAVPAAGARPHPGTADRAGAPRAAPAAPRHRPGRAGPAAPPLAAPRAPPALIGCATLRPLLKGLRQLPAARRRATPPARPQARPMTSRQAKRTPADRPLAEAPACNGGGTAPPAEGEPPGDSLSTRWRRWPLARAQAGLLPPPLGPFPSPPVQPCVRLEEAQTWQ
ncbi:transcriptional regulatory protein AlgP-like [Pyrgilauda ruficollis]|uniref:transcriptional regulatory protein AlgP-like n=1 Tax=Pyrgilauda ruficollis TaxID=221976 RepID=UPI001B8838AB|nr:transcriptional regulatory protein AlgP-like [Pyrgilauda ruficollis]